jgi:predicted nuclease of predicted toxin-antitoxin system
MPTPRLLLDENVTWELATALRERGHDVLHVRDLGLLGADDETVFAAAIRDERTVLTRDVVDFIALARQYAEGGEHHFGLIVTRQRSFSDLLWGALRLLSSRTVEDLRDAVVWID